MILEVPLDRPPKVFVIHEYVTFLDKEIKDRDVVHSDEELIKISDELIRLQELRIRIQPRKEQIEFDDFYGVLVNLVSSSSSSLKNLFYQAYKGFSIRNDISNFYPKFLSENDTKRLFWIFHIDAVKHLQFQEGYDDLSRWFEDQLNSFFMKEQGWGFGEVTITSLILSDKEGHATNVFSPFDEVIFTFSFTTKIEIPTIKFGIIISDKNGREFISFGKEHSSVNGTGLFTLQIDELPLNEGSYDVSVCALSQDLSYPYHYCKSMTYIAVSGIVKDNGGPVAAKGSWTFRKA